MEIATERDLNVAKWSVVVICFHYGHGLIRIVLSKVLLVVSSTVRMVGCPNFLVFPVEENLYSKGSSNCEMNPNFTSTVTY